MDKGWYSATDFFEHEIVFEDMIRKLCAAYNAPPGGEDEYLSKASKLALIYLAIQTAKTPHRREVPHG